ncbi:MAG: hypothetical protein U0T75_09685 [Chitinophagales bacterium]
MKTLHPPRDGNAQPSDNLPAHKARVRINPQGQLRPAVTQIKILEICAREKQLHKSAQMQKIVMDESPVLPRFNTKNHHMKISVTCAQAKKCTSMHK